MHKSAGDDGFLFGDHLVAIAAFQPLLELVALVVAVLHLKEVPHHAVLPHRRHQMPLLLPVLRHLHTHNNIHIHERKMQQRLYQHEHSSFITTKSFPRQLPHFS
uniref:Uncharacterized protein n=1 Tax=Leersia perrieri TaxID=77586 RepID=A0A0D9VCW8_9ORYZ